MLKTLLVFGGLRATTPLAVFVLSTLALAPPARGMDDPLPLGDLVLEADGVENLGDLQDPEKGLGPWADPASTLGKVRDTIQDITLHDDAMRDWFCAIDQKINAGDIQLAQFDAADSSSASELAGLDDDNTAGVNRDSLDSIREASKRNEEPNQRELLELATILVHELTHTSQSDTAQAQACEQQAEPTETSACACEHAGVYSNVVQFLLLLKVSNCISSEAYPNWATHSMEAALGQAVDDWLSAREHCQAGKDAGEHQLDPLGETPGAPPEGQVPISMTFPTCGSLQESYPLLHPEPDSPEGWGGYVDPNEDGDDNPCTNPPEEPEEGDGGETGGEEE